MTTPLTRPDLSRHQRAPLLEAAMAFVARRQAPFYSPGHKGGRTLDAALQSRIAQLDLNNLPDTDTLHCPTGPIHEAEQLLADAYGTDRSFLLVGGSTAGNIAALLSTVGPGDRVLVQRNAHKSVIAGLVHCGALPVWLAPEYNADFGIALGVSAASVEEACAREPHAKALVVLNPTYFGTTPDIDAIAQVCARKQILLLADEAHGAHFHFSDQIPKGAEDVGADAVVQSAHKTLSALSQAAVLHTRDRRVDHRKVRKVLQLIETTSPSFAIMASIDTARRQMVLDGAELIGQTLVRARHARAELARIPGIEVLRRSHLHGAGSGFYDLDETKIVLRVDALGMTGYDVQRALNRDHGVQPELSGTPHVLLIMTIGNTDEDVERLVAAMRDIARGGRRGGAGGRETPRRAWVSPPCVPTLPPVAMTPREAFYSAAAPCAFASALGRVSSEVVTPYPPGIPALMPGERVTRDVLEGLAAVRDAGCPVSSSDPTLTTLLVVA